MPNNVTVYVMTIWRNLPSKDSAIDATNLNHLEQGIKNVTDFVNTINATSGLYLSQTPFTTALKNKLDGIEAQANKYVLPTASNSTLGGVKVDAETITIDQNGVIHAAAATTQLSALTDVNLTDLEEGQILKWDATAEKWVNTSEAEVRTQLSLLEDVDIDDPQDGDTLKYNANTEKWENGTGGDVLDYDETLQVLGLPAEPVYMYNLLTAKMTSDNTPSGRVFYSSCYNNSSNYYGWRSFDQVLQPSSEWASASGDFVGAYIGYQFQSPVVVGRLIIYNRDLTGLTNKKCHAPKQFKFQASNDGTNWVDLATCNVAEDTSRFKSQFEILNNTLYSYYRMYYLEAFEDDGDNASIGEIEMYEKILV